MRWCDVVADNDVVIIVESSPLPPGVQWSQLNIEIIIQLPIYATKLSWKNVLWTFNGFVELKINAVLK